MCDLHTGLTAETWERPLSHYSCKVLVSKTCVRTREGKGWKKEKKNEGEFLSCLLGSPAIFSITNRTGLRGNMKLRYGWDLAKGFFDLHYLIMYDVRPFCFILQ